MSDDPKATPPTPAPKPIHDVSQFKSPGEYLRAGHCGTQMAWGLDRYMQKHHCTFPEAYAALVGRGAILEIAPPATSSEKEKE